MSKLTDWLLDLFFPTRCVFCRKPLNPGRPRICPECKKTIPDPYRTRFAFVSECVSACSYEGTAASAIRRFKFENSSAYAYAFGELVAERIYEDLWGEFDVLSWVPLSADRRWFRGYDQSKLIAEDAARRLCIPLVPTLKKKPFVSRQSKTKSAAVRRANILGVYSVPKPELVKGKRILLIDDIVTTGATISECARTLQIAGAADVLCAALAHTPKKSAS